MSVAYSLRNFNRKGIEMRDMGSFSGQLLLRSFNRAERVYNSMKCRGYALGYTLDTALQIKPIKKRTFVLQDFIFLIIVCLLCATFRFVDINALLTGFLGRFL